LRSRFLIARKALRLDRRGRAQAARAITCLFLARLAVALVPYGTLRNMVSHVRPRYRGDRGMTPDECARAIGRARRVLPSTRCLPLALAAEYLLRREGGDARVTIGARFDERGRLRAHAWVESDGTTVTGEADLRAYVPLAPPRVP
jgi:hypothetical protein